MAKLVDIEGLTRFFENIKNYFDDLFVHDDRNLDAKLEKKNQGYSYVINKAIPLTPMPHMAYIFMDGIIKRKTEEIAEVEGKDGEIYLRRIIEYSMVGAPSFRAPATFYVPQYSYMISDRHPVIVYITQEGERIRSLNTGAHYKTTAPFVEIINGRVKNTEICSVDKDALIPKRLSSSTLALMPPCYNMELLIPSCNWKNKYRYKMGELRYHLKPGTFELFRKRDTKRRRIYIYNGSGEKFLKPQHEGQPSRRKPFTQKTAHGGKLDVFSVRKGRRSEKHRYYLKMVSSKNFQIVDA